VLAFPNPDLPCEVVVDACAVGCVAVLLQNHRPVAVHNYKFREEICGGEQELLAVMSALRQWRCHLEAAKEAIAKVRELLGIDQHMSTALRCTHTQTDRLTECTNMT